MNRLWLKELTEAEKDDKGESGEGHLAEPRVELHGSGDLANGSSVPIQQRDDEQKEKFPRAGVAEENIDNGR